MVGRLWTEEEKARRRVQYAGKGNPFYGRRHTRDTKSKITFAKQGENPSYGAIHKRLYAGKTGICSKCEASPGASGWKGTQSALIHGRPIQISNTGKVYSVNIDDYVEMCRSCHTYYDNEERRKHVK